MQQQHYQHLKMEDYDTEDFEDYENNDVNFNFEINK